LPKQGHIGYSAEANESQENSATATSVDNAPDDIEIKQRVDKAFAAVRNGDFTLLDDLIAHAAEALPYLNQYTDDPNPLVRREIISIARRINSEESLKLLSILLNDRDSAVASRSAMIIYDNYTNEALVKYGGDELKVRLIDNIRYHKNIAYAIILLSCFKENEVNEFLKEQRNENKSLLTKYHMPDKPIPIYECIDLTLAILNDKDAIERTLIVLKEGNPTDLLFILYSLKCINEDHVIFKDIIELLLDKRDAKPGGPSGTGYMIRVCDVALESLVSKTGIVIGLDKDKFQGITRYSDQQLKAVYDELLTRAGRIPPDSPRPQ